MSVPVTLMVYALLIAAASVAGGMLPMLVRLTHRRMQFCISAVAGFVLGVALLHLLPHAMIASGAEAEFSIQRVALWALGGFLLMFFLERFFCFHHHDAPLPGEEAHAAHDDHAACGHTHDVTGASRHKLSWVGVAIGLTLHSVIAGMVLAASVSLEHAERASGGWA